MLSIKFMFPSNEARRRFITFCPVLLMEIKRGVVSDRERERERERERAERRERQTDRQKDRTKTPITYGAPIMSVYVCLSVTSITWRLVHVTHRNSLKHDPSYSYMYWLPVMYLSLGHLKISTNDIWNALLIDQFLPRNDLLDTAYNYLFTDTESRERNTLSVVWQCIPRNVFLNIVFP